MSSSECIICPLILPVCSSVCASDSTCLIRAQTCQSCASASCVPNSQISPEVLAAAVDGTATTTATGDATSPFPTVTVTTSGSFSSLTSLIGNSTTTAPSPSNNLTIPSTVTVTTSLPNSSSITTTVVAPPATSSDISSTSSATDPTSTGVAGPSVYGMASGSQGLALSVLALWAAVGMVGGRRFRI